MAKFEYTEEMVARMESACGGGINEDIIESLCEAVSYTHLTLPTIGSV